MTAGTRKRGRRPHIARAFHPPTDKVSVRIEDSTGTGAHVGAFRLVRQAVSLPAGHDRDESSPVGQVRQLRHDRLGVGPRCPW